MGNLPAIEAVLIPLPLPDQVRRHIRVFHTQSLFMQTIINILAAYRFGEFYSIKVNNERIIKNNYLMIIYKGELSCSKGKILHGCA